MKKVLAVLLLACLASAAWPDAHPQAAEIQAYLDERPIDPRIPELMVKISLKSSDLNDRGFAAYSQGRYEEALDLFRAAAETDADNSFAFYNMACTLSLLGGSRYGEMLEPLRRAVSAEWVWGLQLMVDPDIDAWRYADASLTIRNTEMPDVPYPVFLHVLRPDGTVTLSVQYGPDVPPRELGRGWYCVVCWKPFEFFPEVGAYAVEGPNGPIPVPAERNKVWLPQYSFPK